MKPTDMHMLAHRGCHDACSPKGWHDVPNLTGDYDFDATIEHRNNKNLPQRLWMYVKRGDSAYGYKTGYDGYHGYSGDD